MKNQKTSDHIKEYFILDNFSFFTSSDLPIQEKLIGFLNPAARFIKLLFFLLKLILYL